MLAMHLAYFLVQILSTSVATSLLFSFVKWLNASDRYSLCVASKLGMCVAMQSIYYSF